MPLKVVIFDVDDTALSGYNFMLKHQFKHYPGFDTEFINQFNAPAIPTVLKFYHYLAHRGIKVVFLSERSEVAYSLTALNLMNAGYRCHTDRLILRSMDRCLESVSIFKSQQRRVLTEEGLDIVAVVGDQMSDFYGGNAGFHIKLPNYLYNIV